MGALLTVVVLIAASAFFVAAEFALVAARRSRIEPDAITSARARVTLSAMEDVSVMMACAQLGITVCGLVLGAVGEPALAHLIAPPLRALGLPAAALHPISLILALAIVVGLHVSIGEMLPKNIALAHPERTAVLLAPVLRGIAAALGPLVRGLDHLANLVVRALGITPTSEVSSVVTGAEVAQLVAQSAAAGLIDPEDEQLIGAALTFAQAKVRDVTVADDRITCVGPRPTAAEVEDACARSGFSRFPVLSDAAGTDTFAGYIHVRDVLTAADRDHPLPDDLVRPMPSVDALLPLRTAVADLQRAQAHMCRVVDADGPLGVAWLEDMIEVLVGDIVDATGRQGR